MDEKGLVEVIVKRLVDSPEDVSIKEVNGEKSIILELRVNADDIGKVIGKGGRIISAIRTLLYSVVATGDKRILLEVIE